MNSYLREGVHGVVIGDDLALIDLDADGYLCLPGGASTVTGVADGHLLLGGDGLSALAAAGLIADTPPTPGKRMPPSPRRTIIYEPSPRLSLQNLIDAGWTVRDVRMALRKTGLKPILALASDDKDPAGQLTAVESAKAFWKIAPWLPLEGECLVRSAMLVAFLRRSGLSADWIFGVRLWPFSAHCWVQVGDLCLNDDVERLVAYTPIYCR